MIERIADLVNADAIWSDAGDSQHDVSSRDRRSGLSRQDRRRSDCLGHSRAVRDAELQLRLRAPARQWEVFWEKVPTARPQRQFALFKRGELTIEGDLHPFMANLLYIKDVLRHRARRQEANDNECRASSPSTAAISISICSAARIGSTSRRPARASRCFACTPQARTDGSTAACSTSKRITDNFRVIAFDMPWHGKSSPPEGYQNEEYTLTSRGYIQMILEIADALELDKPGGDGLLDRRAHRALSGPPACRRFRAIIGLESAAHVAPTTSRMAAPV